jgi:short-subunit dehydrogenase
MATNLIGKNVIITGASSGVGNEVARLFAENGSNLAIAARSGDKLHELQKLLSKHKVKVHKVVTDVSKLTDCKNLITEAAKTLGSIDILVNNAGYTSQGKFEEVPINELEQIIEVNFTAPIRLTKLALPYLKESPAGRIINVASILGIIPIPTEAVYSATKFALRGFSYALSEELSDTHVKVCLISPGPIETPFIMDNMDKVHDLVFSPPMSSPREIAELIIKSAQDGKMERIKPLHTGILAKIGFLMPPLQKIVKPIMEKQGARNKARYSKRDN